MRNREVESLGGWSLNLAIRQLIFGLLRQQGVTFQLVQRGLDNTCFEKGLENWRARHPEQVLDTAQEETTCAEPNALSHAFQVCKYGTDDSRTSMHLQRFLLGWCLLDTRPLAHSNVCSTVGCEKQFGDLNQSRGPGCRPLAHPSATTISATKCQRRTILSILFRGSIGCHELRGEQDA